MMVEVEKEQPYRASVGLSDRVLSADVLLFENSESCKKQIALTGGNKN